MALACGDPYYMAPASARRMAVDLSVLPAWYAEPGSRVAVGAVWQQEYMVEKCPLPLPVEWGTEPGCDCGRIVPWGWSPALVRRLREAGVREEVCPSAGQMERIRCLSGRATAVGVLRRLRADEDFRRYTVGESFLLRTLDEVEAFVEAHPAGAVLKAPWSGSGRGIQYAGGSVPASLAGWIGHVLHTQQAVVAEPLYGKVVDFAMEFKADGRGRVCFAGYSLFETDRRGIYKGNLLASDEEIERRLSDYVPCDVLYSARRRLESELERTLQGGYAGWLGVDMMVCASPVAGQYTLHPCVEVNLRMNMGVVARIFYDRYVCCGVQGRYIIEYYARAGEALAACLAAERQYPLRLEGGRIRSGYLSLTPVRSDTSCQVYVLLG